MFPGRGGDMAKMMKQMGIDMEEIDADRVEVHVGEKKLVFDNPQLSKVDGQGMEMFQLQGDYHEETEVSEDDIELVKEKTGASEEEARKALENADDVAGAVMELQ
ncbi:MAG: nascent polypeptide-associated complex protein [Candidatus Nanohaloarchaea archaeon]